MPCSPSPKPDTTAQTVLETRDNCDKSGLMEVFLLALEEAKENHPVTVKYIIYVDL